MKTAGLIVTRFSRTVLPGVLVAACAATTPGGRPHDMSAEAHEGEAAGHADAGEQHAAKYDPAAAKEQVACAPLRGSRSGANGAGTEDICWTSVQNPTAIHLDEDEKHRRQAADHRAASAALRDAEAQACAGVGASDRDMSPFEHRDDIVSVKPLQLSEFDGRSKMPPERLLGAVVTFRAVPGLTAEWLQRVVSCHLARNAALGHVVPEMPDCPLVPPGVEARVTTAGDGFAVALRSNDPKIAREVLARAGRLTDRTSSVHNSPGAAAPDDMKGTSR